MTFLNPTALYALPLIALPTLIHLLARQRAKIVRFSSLRFLQEMEHSEIRRLKLREIVLLVLRTLAVASLVLLAARPAIVPEGVSATAVGSKTAVFVVLDDSYSMNTWTNQGSLYRIGSDIAARIAATLRPGDSGILVLPRGVNFPASQYRLSPLGEGSDKENLWKSAPALAVENDFEEPLQLARNWSQRHQGYRREVYFISDFAGVRVPSDSALRSLQTETQVFLIPVRRPSVANLSLVGVRLENQIIQPGTTLPIAVRVANTGDLPMEERLVQLYWNGQPVAQSTVTLQPGESQDVVVRVIPSSPGWQRGVVVLEDDALAEDNRLWFTLRIPQRLKALILSSGSEGDAVRLALSPPGAEPVLYEVQSKRPEETSSGDIRSADLVVLANAGPLGVGLREELIDKVRGGGCLIVLPGAKTDLRWLSRDLLRPLGIPALAGTYGQPGAAVPATVVSWMDRQHPVFRGIFEKRRTSVSLPLIYFGVRVSSESGVNVILRCSNGAPFLFEGTAGAGKVFVFTSGPDPDWSDLARKGIFVALMQRLPVYATFQVGSRSLRQLIGEPIEVLDPRLPVGAVYELERPEGVRVRLAPQALPGGTRLAYAETDQPGVYNLYVDGHLDRSVAVNPNPEEANLAVADVGKLANSAGVTLLEPAANLEEQISVFRRGRELWSWLAGGLLALMVAEVLLSRSGGAAEEVSRGERAKQRASVSV